MVALNLGENLIHHDTYHTGPGVVHSTIHAYLKRLLISTTHADCVALVSKSDEENGASLRAPPRGVLCVVCCSVLWCVAVCCSVL